MSLEQQSHTPTPAEQAASVVDSLENGHLKDAKNLVDTFWREFHDDPKIWNEFKTQLEIRQALESLTTKDKDVRSMLDDFSITTANDGNGDYALIVSAPEHETSPYVDFIDPSHPDGLHPTKPGEEMPGLTDSTGPHGSAPGNSPPLDGLAPAGHPPGNTESIVPSDNGGTEQRPPKGFNWPSNLVSPQG